MRGLNIVLALVMGLASAAHAATYQGLVNEEFGLNRAAQGEMQKNQLGTIVSRRAQRLLKCRYDFAIQGGAVGALSLLDEKGKACKIPKNALVDQVYLDVLTTFTSSGSATAAIGSGASATDFKAATAFGSYTGVIAGIPVGTAASAVKMAADNLPTITIATAALTAGKLNVLIMYLLSD